MKILRLSYVNLKRIAKNKTNLALMLIGPLILILGTHFVNKSEGYYISIDSGFYMEDEGSYGEEILESMDYGGEILYDYDEAMELLEKNKIIALYIIPSDFTEKIKNGEKPIIESYKREEGNNTAPLELELEDKINNKIREDILLNSNIIKDRAEIYEYRGKVSIIDEYSGIGGDAYMSILLIIYMIILSSTGIGEEMLKLKKQNILSRAMTTANKGYEIMGSLFLSTLFLSTGSNLLVLFITKSIIGYSINSLPIVIINIIMASMFSITLTIFLIRISEDPSLVSIGTAIYAVASFSLSGISSSPDFYPNVPKAIINLGKFMPQYWIMDSIENTKLFPNILVLGLMIIALFTAGSYKFRDFANK